MAFKKAPSLVETPDSPEKLLRELPRRKIPDVLPHQSELMRLYKSRAVELPDIALQLPTGSGKTLVGLLIAEWRRRKYQERVIYLCPTRQLVNQVVEQAREKYGLTVLGFTGPKNGYPQVAQAEYRSAKRVAVTTYSSLFNINPFFYDADIIIVDDVHVAENYISDFWSVRVEFNAEHEALHTALQGIIKPLLSPLDFSRFTGQEEIPADQAWVDKIPTPRFLEILDDIAEIFDQYIQQGTDIAYRWQMVRDNLRACHFYLSVRSILIRPLISPTWLHAPFHNPKQRIYMSATLGAGGDLERLTGRYNIKRLFAPKGWDRQGVGRRFFIFPNMSLDAEQAKKLRHELMERTERSLILVPSDRAQIELANDIQEGTNHKVLSADDIEKSKQSFVSRSEVVAIVANRYDGIDFRGNECRLVFVEGLPKATNLQERFLMTRMGANVLFNERIQTRVLQAIGRCTRSLEDYSAVVVTGSELVDYLADIHRRKFLHPEIQAEIEFGVEQSIDTSPHDIVENFIVFLENGEDWEKVNQSIVVSSKSAVQESFPAMAELSDVVAHEIKFQKKLWQGNYRAALNHAECVLEKLKAPELRGYRALWHYLAGSASWLGANESAPELFITARSQFSKARDTTQSVPWLSTLADYQVENSSIASEDPVLMEQIEKVESILAQLGIHGKKFTEREKTTLNGLMSNQKSNFEQAHRLLGELLGFDSGNEETDGAPDPWWIVCDMCIVFEDHAGAQSNSVLNVKKARQVASHPNWMRSNVEASAKANILAVLVTPVKKVQQGAMPHLSDVSLWPLDEFRSWGANAVAIIRKMRSSFSEPGNLAWRAETAEAFIQNGMDAHGLYERLQSKIAAENLEPKE